MKCLSSLSNNDLALNVYVQPRASKSRIAGMHGNSIKLCVTAPPVDNKANEAVIHFLADLFGVPKSAVAIKSGKQGRSKKVLLSNLSLNQAKETLSAALAKS
jgi:uncharacterized protein (TIGR00251 family)